MLFIGEKHETTTSQKIMQSPVLFEDKSTKTALQEFWQSPVLFLRTQGTKTALQEFWQSLVLSEDKRHENRKFDSNNFHEALNQMPGECNLPGLLNELPPTANAFGWPSPWTPHTNRGHVRARGLDTS